MLPNIEVRRQWTSREYGTFSVVTLNKIWFCIGVEPYDYGNTPDESCIPEGQYRCLRVPSTLVTRMTHGLIITTFEAVHVPNRSLIRFHPGNTDEDTQGCILLGDKLGKLGVNHAVLNSGETFRRFMAELEGYDELILTVRNSY